MYVGIIQNKCNKRAMITCFFLCSFFIMLISTTKSKGRIANLNYNKQGSDANKKGVQLQAKTHRGNQTEREREF